MLLAHEVHQQADLLVAGNRVLEPGVGIQRIHVAGRLTGDGHGATNRARASIPPLSQRNGR